MLVHSAKEIVYQDFIEAEDAEKKNPYTFKTSPDFLKKGEVNESVVSNSDLYDQRYHNRLIAVRRMSVRRIVLMVTLVVLLLCASLVMANPKVRDQLNKLWTYVFKDHFVIDSGDDIETEGIKIFQLNNVPEDYRLVEITDESPERYREIYENKAGDLIIWSILNSENQIKMYISAEGGSPEQYESGEGTDLYYASDGSFQSVYCKKNGCVYLLQGKLEKAVILHMLETTCEKP